MKNIKVLFAVLILIIVSTACSGISDDALARTTFLTTIDCQDCKDKLFDNLPFEDGVEELAVDIPSKEVTIVYDKTKTDKNKLIEAIKKVGYEAKEIQK